jgi:hypothetical protein
LTHLLYGWQRRNSTATARFHSRASREVTLLTFDSGMSTRARHAGLRVEKLTKPIGGEPAKAAR